MRCHAPAREKVYPLIVAITTTLSCRCSALNLKHCQSIAVSDSSVFFEVLMYLIWTMHCSHSPVRINGTAAISSCTFQRCNVLQAEISEQPTFLPVFLLFSPRPQFLDCLYAISICFCNFNSVFCDQLAEPTETCIHIRYICTQ